MTGMEQIYLGMIFVAFTAFALVLLHVNHRTDG